MTKDEALKLALEAFEWNYNTDLDNIPAYEKWAKMLKENITAIREALSQPELTLDGLTPTEFALRELYEFQEATGCDTAAEFKAQPRCDHQESVPMMVCKRCLSLTGVLEQEPVAWLHTKIEGVAVPHRPAEMNFRLVQQALAALEMYREHTPEGNGVAEQAIEALKQFKKEWVKTEVPYVVVECNCSGKTTIYSPPKRTWVGLTTDELNMIGDGMRTWNSYSLTDVYFAIEAKLKEKNT